MLTVDQAHFANLVSAIQRTASLTGGAVRGLPGGVVVQGLDGVGALAAEVSEAQKEHHRGRIHVALERIKQVETQFNACSGRWHSSVGGLISSTRQGNQKLSIQKLNEVKNAQTKMQQLTGPAIKAFRDLISALEHEVASDPAPRREDQPSEASTKVSPTPTEQPEAATPSGEPKSPQQERDEPERDEPDTDRLGQYANNYRFGDRLQWLDRRIEPPLESGRFYFLAGLDPPRVVRVRSLRGDETVILDTKSSSERTVAMFEWMTLIRQGAWQLVSR